MQPHQLINQDSGSAEWFTPPYIVEGARLAMGHIDLDPASNTVANQLVRADAYFDSFLNGLSYPWYGRVWLNHPYSRENNKVWIAKLIDEYEQGNVVQACCITFTSTSEKWCAPLLSYPVCFLLGRVAFLRVGEDGNLESVRGNTKGSMVTYLGPNVRRFCSAFRDFGNVLVPR